MITIEEIQEAGRIAKEKHPVNPVGLTFGKVGYENILKGYQGTNDLMEKEGCHVYEGLILEEVYEALTAKTRDERHAEIVQAIALLVRLDEDENV